MKVNRNQDYCYRKGDWIEVLEAARETVGKAALETEPSETWKLNMMIAEHSPIRCLVYRWKWHNIKYWITNHLVRHMWEPFIKSQRNDRNGTTVEERDALPQGAMVQMIGEANAQHCIDTSRKRLCYNAHPETRTKWEWLKIKIGEIDSSVEYCMVPNCIYRGGCPELKSCGYYENLFKDYKPKNGLIGIRERYDVYKNDFDRRYKRER